MPVTNKDSILWLKATFGANIAAALAGTPFSTNLVVAIAMQETSYLWRPLIKTKTPAQILALCAGDTIDAPGRKAFPKTRAELEAFPGGTEMFKLARADLLAVGTISDAYKKVADKFPDKFCHGFGMFQYDLQYFKVDPQYFLQRKWTAFSETLAKCVSELRSKLALVYPGKTQPLSHKESVYVAIAYNKGSADLGKDFKQGHEQNGKFYGELIDEFLTLAESTA